MPSRNLFEFWFVAVVVVAHFPPAFTWTPARPAAVLAALLVLKLAQEWALLLDALHAMWHAVTDG